MPKWETMNMLDLPIIEDVWIGPQIYYKETPCLQVYSFQGSQTCDFLPSAMARNG